MPVIDMTGRVCGRLTVLERVENIGTAAAWSCRCECGGTKVARGADLQRGATRSCGCIKRETLERYRHDPRRKAAVAAYWRSPEGRARSAAMPKNTTAAHEYVRSAEGREWMAQVGRAGRGDSNARWTGDGVGYFGAHNRVRNTRGPAWHHACVGCGTRYGSEEQADAGAEGMQWACDLDHPGTRPAPDNGCPINPDPMTYLPMCWQCHLIYDLAHGGRRTHSG